MKLIIWDVQHGSAAYVETPAGTRIIQDLGMGSNEDSQFSPIHHLANNRNLPRIDALIITHPHRDHLADIENLYRTQVGALYRPSNIPEQILLAENRSPAYRTTIATDVVDAYCDLGSRYSHPIYADNDPLLAQNNGGVTVRVFQPHCPDDCNINNYSLVSVIEYAGFKIVIPGDNEEPSWNSLISQAEFRGAIAGADVFVAAHHGRRSGYYPDLFSHFTPMLVIISDGPCTETNVSNRYSSWSGPCTVWHRRGKWIEERNCVTTRNDGVIYLEIDGTGSYRVHID
jgi:competence protein ComEC